MDTYIIIMTYFITNRAPIRISPKTNHPLPTTPFLILDGEHKSDGECRVYTRDDEGKYTR